ncbi:helix-turn-helix domain-containing protein [Marinisporobacter balticus]|uniref:Transcriptional regulator with XRE-family HTH domain n=1 Tax=Marinisporobacter balticus TaxID=2018667 RepID=A0A4R2L8R4_9FIRM|nr:helix-turn-helix transcriptional regulator [Marinisporobacter balticus]TCO79098.1 transcriptional regulator with XRE-family HTH domain [Marinisporobacter balticus]
MRKYFGDRLKELRVEKNLTQEELAKIFNTGKASISHYESNRRMPDAHSIEKFAEFFSVSTDYLLGRTDIKSPSNDEIKIETKAYHNLNIGGLAEEDISKVEEYIELLKQKYNPDGTLKKK